MGAYWLSTLQFKGKIKMDIVLNATLSGAITIGAGADILERSYIAYTVGILSGIFTAI